MYLDELYIVYTNEGLLYRICQDICNTYTGNSQSLKNIYPHQMHK